MAFIELKNKTKKFNLPLNLLNYKKVFVTFHLSKHVLVKIKANKKRR